MACQFLPCNCCNRLLKSTSVAITGTSPNQVLTITIPSMDLENLTDYCLIICQSFPTGSDALPVVINDGGTVVPLLCKKGNNIHADQLCTRRKYNVTYGNDPIHLLINNCVTRTCCTV